jgi:hypothetical protein
MNRAFSAGECYLVTLYPGRVPLGWYELRAFGLKKGGGH